MRRLIFAWIIVAAIALTGCPQPGGRNIDHHQVVLDIVYTKDARTGICFAYGYDDDVLNVITVVPCDKVEQYLVK
jgi:hypothetical protein